MISAKYEIPVTSPGAILREEKRLGTPLGFEADQLTANGQLLPDQTVNALVETWLLTYHPAFVLDGYPRSIGQADALAVMLESHGSPLQIVICLEADQSTIEQRVQKRLVCEGCGTIVSIGLHVSAEDTCPKCGGRLVKRADDNLETLAFRMCEYRQKTEPLISYYRSRGLLHVVDSTRAPDVVQSEIVGLLEAA